MAPQISENPSWCPEESLPLGSQSHREVAKSQRTGELPVATNSNLLAT